VKKIEVLVDKTDDLNNQSQSFKKKGTKLKKKMWWKNAKLTCCLVTVCVFILLVIVFLILDYFDVFKFLPDIFHGNTNNDTTQTTFTYETSHPVATTVLPTSFGTTSSITTH